MPLAEYQYISLAAFVIAIAPLTYGELRGKTLSNLGNLVLLALGCVVNLVGLYLEVFAFDWSVIGYDIAIATALLALFATRSLPGGTTKFLIALLPWLSLEAYIAVFIFTMLSIVAITQLRGTQSAPATPGAAIGALGAMAFALT